MNAAARRALHRPSRLQTRRDARPRPLSDMAAELLAEIMSGLGQLVALDAEDERVLRHFLQARGPADAALATRVGLSELALRRRLASIYAATGTQTRRQLLTLGLSLARQPARAS